MKTYKEELLKLRREKLKEFNKNLIPNLDKELIGVSNPNIKKLSKNVDYEFLENLPHKYYEEDILHGYMLANLNLDFDKTIVLIEKFLPYVTNWAVCDTMCKNIKAFKNDRKKLFDKTLEWCQTNKTYYIRFALSMQLSYCLTDEFIDDIIENIYTISNHDYYCDMMIAWLLATIMINYENKVFDALKQNKLNVFIKRKTISKAIDSFRISDTTKMKLKELRKFLF